MVNVSETSTYLSVTRSAQDAKQMNHVRASESPVRPSESQCGPVALSEDL